MAAGALTSVLLEKLATATIDQVGRVLGVRSDFRKLESALSAIQAVILAAEERSSTERDVRDWVAKLKDAAYDADDLLDEFHTYAEWHKHDTSMSNKVRIFFSRSNSLAFRIKMSFKIKTITEKLDMIAQERSRYNFSNASPSETLQQRMEARMTFDITDETNVYGRDDDVKNILKLLLEKETVLLSVVTIVGMGGLGKTTLTQQVYNHERITKQESFDQRIWVCVSDPFDIKRIAKSIIEYVTQGGCDLSELAPIVNRVRVILTNKKFLLVLDDVWNDNQEKWEKLKEVLAVGTNGSKIIVTTRSVQVAFIMSTISPYQLEPLSKDACWRLFEKRAFMGIEDVQREPFLETIGKEIVAKCKGSPLAAKALGSLMRFKRERGQWLAVRDNNIWIDEGNQVMASLRLSYDHLPPHLKQCFAYCSIFPKDTWIERDELVLHWIAMGFIPSNTSLRSAIIKGHKYFNDLVWISFLDEHDEPESYKMHDLVHDLAKSVAGDEHFICYADQKTTIPRRCCFCTLVGSWNEPELKQLFRKSSKVRALRLESSNINTSILFTSLPRLRVLDMKGSKIKELHASINRLQHLRYFRSHDLLELPNSIGRLRNLQILRTSCCQLRSLPQSFTSLQNLQTLDLSRCDRLGSLPESLDSLQNLQNLNLSNCHSLGSLPESLNGLLSLQNLNLQGCSSLVSLPESIGKLANLWVLDISYCRALHSLPQSLGNLSNLETLYLIECLRIHELPESIGKLANLRTLYLSSCRALHSLPQSLGNLSNLDGLYLTECFCIAEIPESIGKLANLRTLNISECICIAELPESIGKLTNLRTLDLSYCRALHSLPQSLGNLSNIKELHLFKCSGIVELPESIGKLANLRTLRLSSWQALHSLPQSLGNLSDLETLDLSDCFYIAELPESIGKLANLRILRLSFCETLHLLTQSLGNLSNLEDLDLLECSGIVELPESIGKLSKLRILSLSSCEALHSLPQSLGNLFNLEELNLNGCNGIVELPEGMRNLANLRHLWNGRMPSLRGMPLGIGNMRSLITLQLFVVGEGINHNNIAEMQHMNLIAGELELTRLENVKTPGDAARANTKEKHRLKELHLIWSDLIPHDPYSIHEEVLEDLIPHPNLERLEIGCYPGINFPNWVRMMGVLVPNLVKLKLYGLKCLPSFSGGLLQLKELHLLEMPDAEEWLTVADGVELYPRLVKLRIRNCPKLHAKPCIPSSVKRLT